MESQPLYTITNMVPEVMPGPTGRTEHGYRVDFRTATGQHSFVFVPRSDTLDQDVHAAVEAEASKIIGTMTRPGVPPYTPPAQ